MNGEVDVVEIGAAAADGLVGGHAGDFEGWRVG